MIISPVMPSLKYSCCGSPLKLVKVAAAWEGDSVLIVAKVASNLRA